MEWKPEGPVSLICFTRTGAGLCEKLLRRLWEDGICSCGYIKSPAGFPEGGANLTAVEVSLEAWAGEKFKTESGLIFIGAAGIAVRAIARWVRDKFRDPAVVVMDEKAQFAIPILSGHAGGANALACKIAAYVHAVPVLTTATDVQGKFAVDVFAKEHKLWMSDTRLAKEISAEILRGKTIGFVSEFPVNGKLPEGCVPVLPSDMTGSGLNIRVSLGTGEENKEDGKTLYLIPKIVTIGIGCRRGIEKEELKNQIVSALKAHKISPQAVCQAATIDRKEDEAALTGLCREMGWPLLFFSAKELNCLKGEFTHSDFVEKTVGTGNVCERAAMLGSGPKDSRLILNKQKLGGATLAAAAAKWQLTVQQA